jgi:dTDP-4-amino-4,6-dideoxygalactose transaminase
MSQELRHPALEDIATTYERSLGDAAGGGHAWHLRSPGLLCRRSSWPRELAPGDEVVLSPLTCKVVPLALLALGIRPVYADIAPRSLNLDPERAEGRSRALAHGPSSSSTPTG